jgi:hypothetical protein
MVSSKEGSNGLVSAKEEMEREAEKTEEDKDDCGTQRTNTNSPLAHFWNNPKKHE